MNDFLIKNEAAAVLFESCRELQVETHYFYKKDNKNGKCIRISFIDDDLYVTAYEDKKIDKYKIKELPVLVEKYEGERTALLEKYNQYL